MNDQRLSYASWHAAVPGVRGDMDACLILGNPVSHMLGGTPAVSHAKKRPRASA